MRFLEKVESKKLLLTPKLRAILEEEVSIFFVLVLSSYLPKSESKLTYPIYLLHYCRYKL